MLNAMLETLCFHLHLYLINHYFSWTITFFVVVVVFFFISYSSLLLI